MKKDKIIKIRIIRFSLILILVACAYLLLILGRMYTREKYPENKYKYDPLEKFRVDPSKTRANFLIKTNLDDFTKSGLKYKNLEFRNTRPRKKNKS